MLTSVKLKLATLQHPDNPAESEVLRNNRGLHMWNARMSKTLYCWGIGRWTEQRSQGCYQRVLPFVIALPPIRTHMRLAFTWEFPRGRGCPLFLAEGMNVMWIIGRIPEDALIPSQSVLAQAAHWAVSAWMARSPGQLSTLSKWSSLSGNISFSW